MNAILDAALAYAAKGLHVFPARFKGKQKLGHTSAEKSNGRNWGNSCDKGELRKYWRRWPRAAVGIPTGSVNGIFVIDVDTKEGHGADGLSSLQQLEARHGGSLRFTRQAISPTGSVHYYFRLPSGVIIPNSTGLLAPGIDVRGEGGFVIAPPSVRPGFKQPYHWADTIGTHSIAKPPSWLLALVVERRQPERVMQEVDPASCDPTMLRAMLADAGRGISIAPTDNVGFAPATMDDLEQEMRAALMVIPADNYHEWVKVGAAIRAGLGDAGFALFDEWSATSAKYDASDCSEKWTNARHIPAMRSINVATIFWLADQHDREWRDLYRQARAAGVRL